MKLNNKRLIGMVTICSALFVETVPAQDIQEPMLTSAIFIMNRAGEKYDDKLDVLNDMISTRLTEKGFSVIDAKEVANRFREYNSQNRSNREARDVTDAIKSLLPDNEEVTKKSLDELVSSQSAKKIATLLNADYLIIATINSVGSETRKGTAYGQKMGTVTTTMRVALKVLEGNLGGTIAGTIVEAKDRTPLIDGVEVVNTDLPNQLLNQCALQASEMIGKKVHKIREMTVSAAALVSISVAANIDGAAVSIDDLAYGTTPCTILVPQGPSTLKITMQGFKAEEKFISPFQGLSLNVNLEMTEEGLRRWKDVEAFKLSMEAEKNKQAIEKEQGSADAYATKQIAEGEKKKLEQTHTNDDGLKDAIKEIIHGH